jgi:hypothetical protein
MDLYWWTRNLGCGSAENSAWRQGEDLPPPRNGACGMKSTSNGVLRGGACRIVKRRKDPHAGWKETASGAGKRPQKDGVGGTCDGRGVAGFEGRKPEGRREEVMLGCAVPRGEQGLGDTTHTVR